MNGADWLREGGLHKLADRLHFTGRHDDVDPSPGPEKCADTDCMTLRALANLAALDHEALVELRRAILQHSPCMVHKDCAPAEEQAATAIQAGEDFKEQYE